MAAGRREVPGSSPASDAEPGAASAVGGEGRLCPGSAARRDEFQSRICSEPAWSARGLAAVPGVPKVPVGTRVLGDWLIRFSQGSKAVS